MPGGICGTWPAFWTVGPNWPSNGEIDIIEGVNLNAQNIMTLHTGAGCSVVQQPSLASTTITGNCDINALGQSQNQGCSTQANNQATFGSQFNTNGGGVYAMEWTSQAISMWFWAHGQQPSDASSTNPNPAGWGPPTALFSGCAIDSFFKDQQIVFDNTFCGAWAGQAWSASSCGSLAPTCQEYVQNNPSAFKDAYWSVLSLRVFQDNGNTQNQAQSSPSPTATPISASVPIATSTPVVAPTPTTTAIQTSLVTQTKTRKSRTGAVTVQPTVVVTQTTYVAPSVTQNGNVVTVRPTVTVTDVLVNSEFGSTDVGIPTPAPGEPQKLKKRGGHLHRHLRHYKPQV